MRKTQKITDVSAAAALLYAGQLVAFPTETVYGLAADATNPQAVAGIFEAKQRPHFDPLIVHVADAASAKRWVTEFGALAERLAEKFWPGPLTLVLPKSSEIPDLVTAGLPGVGIRVPDHRMARALLEASGCPLAAPSANPFGGISPTTADHVLDGLGGRIDAVLDGGPCAVGVESTVLSLMDAKPVLLRPGGLSIEDIEAVIGPIKRAQNDPTRADAAQPAPGMLSRHYAPRTMLRLVDSEADVQPISRLRNGLLTYGSIDAATRQRDGGPLAGFDRIERLSANVELRTCAINFFAGLRSLDAADLDVIIARKFPDHGLGIALNDRLHRAANTYEPH